MKRVKIHPRENWQQKLEDLSFQFHSLQDTYWDESVQYEFSMPEVLRIESATNELWQMMLKAVQHVIDNKLYDQLHINPSIINLVERSWNNEEPSFYGRFDLAYDGKQIKMLEFNADTPTSLYEAAVVQWFWLQEVAKDKDQFNSIHERLISYWKSCGEYFDGELIHFACIKGTIEDFTTVEYIRDTAHQAGLKTKFVYIEDIGWDDENSVFVDLDNVPLKNIFKLYPWEWLSNETFGPCLCLDVNETKWIEPAWKTILSNKGILPILWELFPDHPLLLPTYRELPAKMKNYARKPIYSREGANIMLVKDGVVLENEGGEYGEEGYIYQELFDLPNFDGNYPVVGSWIIDQQAAGMGIREASSRITNNYSRFVPHLIK